MNTSVDQFSALNTDTADTLDSLVKAIEDWRANKSHPGESIPTALWERIFALAKAYPEARIRRLLGIGTQQYRSKYKQLHSLSQTKKQPASNGQQDTVTLCRVDTSEPVPKVAPIATVNTIVVECRRADGQILKIHTSNESIETVMKTFYAGQYDASDHTQT